MSNYENNDINELYELVNIKSSGASHFSAPEGLVTKISKALLKSKNESNIFRRANAYVDMQTRQDYLAKKDSELKQAEAKDVESFLKTQTTKVGVDNKSFYLDEYSDLIVKTRQQRISYTKNGINMFSLPKVVFDQFKKNCKASVIDTKHTIEDKVEEVKDSIEEKKENLTTKVINRNQEINDTKIMKKIIQLLSERIKIDKELEEIRTQYPTIYNEITYVKDDDFIEEVGPRHSSR